jgi:hypothetical protein
VKSSYGIEAKPHHWSQDRVSCDSTCNGWAERGVKDDEGPSDGVSQQISIPKVPQHLNVAPGGRPKSRRCDEETPAALDTIVVVDYRAGSCLIFGYIEPGGWIIG